MANFEAFRRVISSSINLLFLKSAKLISVNRDLSLIIHILRYISKNMKNIFSAAMQAATAPPKPIRKPDPDLRTLQRQISFGSVSGFPAITSLKRKPMSQGMFSTYNIYKFHEKKNSYH